MAQLQHNMLVIAPGLSLEPLCLQSHSRTSAILGDELNPGPLECGNNCLCCPPLSSEDPGLRLEPLDGWQRNERRLRQSILAPTQETACSPNLLRGDPFCIIQSF